MVNVPLRAQTKEKFKNLYLYTALYPTPRLVNEFNHTSHHFDSTNES